MAYTQRLEVRLTHTYRDAWGHLDEWQSVGVFKFLGQRQVREAADYDDGGTYLQRVIAPRGADMVLAKRAVLDNLNYSGCRHDYDCCGCATTRASVLHTHGREMVVRLSVTYNY